jgi:polysaccharide export outer membrane protein
MKHIPFLLIFLNFFLYPQDVNEVLNQLKSSEIRQALQQNNQSKFVFSEEEIEQEKKKETEKKIFQEKSKYFGFDYLKSLSTDIPPYNSLPVPNDYNISFNDTLEIILTGSKNDIFEVSVSLDGSILIPELGRLQVVGKTYSELKTNIKNLIERSYVGTNVDISLTNLSAKKISIIGAIKKPGVYLVNPFTTISNSLAYVDGLEEYASLRRIKLIKGSGQEYTFDLYDLIIKGDRSNDMVVGSGDTVLVESTDNYVSIEGAIYRQYLYEYKASDSFEDLITFALGQTKESAKNRVFIDYQKGKTIVTETVTLKEKVGERNIDKIYVPHETTFNLRDIKVTGTPIEDGYFNPNQYSDLNELFQDLDLSDTFYPFFGFLKQNNPYTFESKVVVFNPTDMDSLKNVELSSNDEIFFFSFDEVRQFNEYKEYLEKEEEEKKLQDETTRKSGFENKLISAESSFDITDSNLQVQRDKLFDEKFFQIDDFDEQKTKKFGKFYSNKFLFEVFNMNLLALNYGNNDIKFLPVGPNIIPNAVLSYLPYSYTPDKFNKIKISANYNHPKDADLNIPIKNPIGASITIPTEDTNFYEVEVRGHVFSPGNYKVSRNTTLQELYNIVGGFLETADQESIILQREKIKEQEKRLAKKARQDILDTLVSSLTNVTTTAPPQIDYSLLAFYQETENLDFFGRFSGRYF